MDKPQNRSNGLPLCNLQMLYIMDKIGASMELIPLREELHQMRNVACMKHL